MRKWTGDRGSEVKVCVGKQDVGVVNRKWIDSSTNGSLTKIGKPWHMTMGHT